MMILQIFMMILQIFGFIIREHVSRLTCIDCKTNTGIEKFFWHQGHNQDSETEGLRCSKAESYELSSVSTFN